MERKVGEIFEYNGEWYQCMHVPQKHSCKLCDLRGLCCDNNGVKIVTCAWRHRKDNTSVIFKKLEKVGEPTMLDGKLVQKILKTDRYSCNGCCFESPECDKADNDLCCEYEIYVEIKQNKEDMEEEKLNLKKFDLEAAKAGKPVCTRDGRKVRIICFDAECNKPIVALIYDCNKETVFQYLKSGRFFVDQIDKYDLMMLPRKKEGWLNIYKDFEDTVCCVYPTEKEALEDGETEKDYITTIKIEWEE